MIQRHLPAALAQRKEKKSDTGPPTRHSPRTAARAAKEQTDKSARRKLNSEGESNPKVVLNSNKSKKAEPAKKQYIEQTKQQSRGKTSADKGGNEDSSVSSKDEDDQDGTLSQETNAHPERHEKENTAKKRKAHSGERQLAAAVVVEKNDSDNAANGDEGELDNTSVVSSPNAAETNDTSNNTTDMHAVMEKENETFHNAWSAIEKKFKLLRLF